MNISQYPDFSLEDLTFYNHKFKYTASNLPPEGSLAFICRGAPEWILYNKHYSWVICAERSLYYDNRGRLGLVIGPVKIIKGVLGIDGKPISQVDKNLIRIEFSPGCRGMWSKNEGIIKLGVTRGIEIHTIREVNRKSKHYDDLKKLLGATKVICDGETIPELNFVPEV